VAAAAQRCCQCRAPVRLLCGDSNTSRQQQNGRQQQHSSFKSSGGPPALAVGSPGPAGGRAGGSRLSAAPLLGRLLAGAGPLPLVGEAAALAALDALHQMLAAAASPTTGGAL
jgi:hypothetical protein